MKKIFVLIGISIFSLSLFGCGNGEKISVEELCQPFYEAKSDISESYGYNKSHSDLYDREKQFKGKTMSLSGTVLKKYSRDGVHCVVFKRGRIGCAPEIVNWSLVAYFDSQDELNKIALNDRIVISGTCVGGVGGWTYETLTEPFVDKIVRDQDDFRVKSHRTFKFEHCKYIGLD